MEHKQLADTGIELPEIGLGTARYTTGDAALQIGVSLGAFLIDTAEIYGTEEAVGKAIKDIRDDVFVATKVSASHFSHGDVLKAADNSLQKLGTDRIDLYQLHSPSRDIPIGETMGAMDRLVEDGKVRFVGVSNFSVAQLKDAQAATANKIVSNQVRYSLVERSIERDLLPYCQENDVMIIAYSPLAVGMDMLKARLRDGALEEVAKAAGKTEAQVALNWCISRPNVIAIPKSDSVERTEENCGASGWRLSGEQVAILEQAELGR
jgi:diketogulonate reductase-like aldo/keto reductase